MIIVLIARAVIPLELSVIIDVTIVGTMLILYSIYLTALHLQATLWFPGAVLFSMNVSACINLALQYLVFGIAVFLADL